MATSVPRQPQRRKTFALARVLNATDILKVKYFWNPWNTDYG